MRCSDSVWAQELDLMQEQLLERLRERLGEQAPQSLRFRVEDAVKLISNYRDLQGLLFRSERAFEGPELVSLCQLAFLPRPRRRQAPDGRGFL